MSMFQDNLYEDIIERNIKDAKLLNIISGYASSNFLERVVNLKPELKINLYIGMALEGISHYNHNKYRTLCHNNKNINVFYLVSQPYNHMKIYEFINEKETLVFSGSANFSENGFFNNIENLFEVQYDLQNSIRNLNYKNCLDENILEYIPLVDLEHDDLLYFEQNKMIKSKNGPLKKLADRIIKKEYQKILYRVKNTKKYTYENKISFEIILGNDSLWNIRGINSIFNKRNSGVFISNNTNRIKEFFNNREDTFFIHTQYNEKFTAQLTNDSNRGLELLDGSLYEFIRREIKLAETRPISYNDLLNAESTKVTIIKIDDDNYALLYGEIN